LFGKQSSSQKATRGSTFLVKGKNSPQRPNCICCFWFSQAKEDGGGGGGCRCRRAYAAALLFAFGNDLAPWRRWAFSCSVNVSRLVLTNMCGRTSVRSLCFLSTTSCPLVMIALFSNWGEQNTRCGKKKERAVTTTAPPGAEFAEFHQGRAVVRRLSYIICLEAAAENRA
jgi:hypothetical protein